MSTRHITIDVAFEDPPEGAIPDSTMYTGGLRVRVDSEILTVFEPELVEGGGSGDGTTYYDAEGAPIEESRGIRGEYLGPTIVGLVEVARVVSGTEDRFPEQQVDLVQSVEALLVVSFLDGEHVRVAFQTDHGRLASPDTPQPPVDRALGRAVDRDAFIEAVADAADDYCAFAEATGWGTDYQDETNETVWEAAHALRDPGDAGEGSTDY